MKTKNKRRIQLLGLIEMIKSQIESAEFLAFARQKPQYFTRKRKMPFTDLVNFMLNMIKSSIQTCLDLYYEQTGQLDVHMSQQAFSEARQKIKWEAFRELFRTTAEHIYTGYYETWHGYRVSAIDGSKIQLPDEENLRKNFGTMGKGNKFAMAQGSALYDVLNNVLLDAQLEPLKPGERDLALRHIDRLRNLSSFDKECVLFDRGYASFALVQRLKESEISFVMRVKTKFSKDIDALGYGDHSLFLRKKGQEPICVRVIKFTLPSGEEETLITDILDKRMSINAFKKLYFKRWPIETKYNEIKNKLEIENFSGLTVNAIKQDFFITMYVSNMAAVACWEAQEIADAERELKDNKYDYHINVNHAVGVIKNRLILAILEDNPRLRKAKIRRMMDLLTFHLAPTRPDRSSTRNTSPRKAMFRHNSKSNC